MIVCESRSNPPDLCTSASQPGSNPSDIAIADRLTCSNGYLLIPEPQINTPIEIRFPLAEREIFLKHRTRDIRVRLKGDSVLAMENHGADLTYFDPL